jgi:hypothetical protein
LNHLYALCTCRHPGACICGTRVRRWAVAAGVAVTMLCVSMVGGPPAGAAAPNAPAASGVPSAAPPTFTIWEPEYTSFLVLSETDDLVEMDLAGDTLWLATERVVTRFRNGVWEDAQTVSDRGDVYALAPIAGGSDAWAFGYEGDTWLRQDDAWRSIAPVTRADLYDALARSESDVWAVGYDYDAGTGVVLHFDGHTLAAETYPWLQRQQLLTVAGEPDGELWVGGCNGNDRPFLMRDRGRRAWESVDLPAVHGCLEDLSFAPDSGGLAAVDGDLLWYDGATWHAFDQAPPDGFGWVRVAAEHGSGASGVAAGLTTVAALAGWALPGKPTWRGYIDGQAPWRFDGTAWAQSSVDYRGHEDLFAPGAADQNPQAFLDMVTDGDDTWSISRSGNPIMPRQAALMALDDASARLAHPLIAGLLGTTYADVAAMPDGTVWASAQFGAAPFLMRSGGQWRVAPGIPFDGTDRFSITAVDMADADTGWAMGKVSGAAPARNAAWRWNGTAWTEVPTPPFDTASAQLRALPNGHAWALSAATRIIVFDGSTWAAMPADAPAVGPVGAFNTPLRAPFDVVATGPALTGWVATVDRLRRYADGIWDTDVPIPRGQVLDVQLVNALRGWAIGRDANPTAARSTGVLLRLVDRAWAEVDLLAPLRQLLAQGRIPARLDPRRIEWTLFAPVDAAEAWCYGFVTTGPLQYAPVLARVVVRDVPAGSPQVDVEVFSNCQLNALSAARVADGTDVWLMSRSACSSAQVPVSRLRMGPVSRLSVRAVGGALYLPGVGR